MSHNVKENMEGMNRFNLFKVDHMSMETLEQSMANNKCGLYVMWPKHVYLGGSTSEESKMVCMLHISYISTNSTKHYY